MRLLLLMVWILDWPPEAGPLKIAEIVSGAEVKVWEKAAHGMYWTNAEQVKKEILDVWSRA